MQNDDREFRDLAWAMARRLPGADEALAAFHARRRAEWAPTEAKLTDLRGPPTALVCADSPDWRVRLARRPVHFVDARSGEES